MAVSSVKHLFDGISSLSIGFITFCSIFMTYVSISGSTVGERSISITYLLISGRTGLRVFSRCTCYSLINRLCSVSITSLKRSCCIRDNLLFVSSFTVITCYGFSGARDLPSTRTIMTLSVTVTEVRDGTGEEGLETETKVDLSVYLRTTGPEVVKEDTTLVV